jgi:ubiquinone/menaquinone biosynthesis C-methylase UbiE
METDYTAVTEVAGDRVSGEQVQRMYTRYYFARQYCNGKDVLDLGCGSGQGLGYLAKVAKKVVGADYSASLLRMTQEHYQDRIPLIRLDAQVLPFKNQSFDVAILFEAIYYLKDPQSFIKECVRVLRPGGTLLICNPNRHLLDFNPSPHSYHYFSAPDFVELLSPFGFQVECFVDCEVDYGDPKQYLLSFIKKTVVNLRLMPKTMAGKKLFKRIVFGKLMPLPPELTDGNCACQLPCVVDPTVTDKCHKVIFALAQKEGRGHRNCADIVEQTASHSPQLIS